MFSYSTVSLSNGKSKENKKVIKINIEFITSVILQEGIHMQLSS
jgi:hypothetical protein